MININFKIFTCLVYMVSFFILTVLLYNYNVSIITIIHLNWSVTVIGIMLYNLKRNEKKGNFFSKLMELVKLVIKAPKEYLILFGAIFICSYIIHLIYAYMYEFEFNSDYHLHLLKNLFIMPILSIIASILIYSKKGVSLKSIKLKDLINNITFTNFFYFVIMYTMLIYSGFSQAICQSLINTITSNIIIFPEILLSFLKLHSITNSLFRKIAIFYTPITNKSSFWLSIKNECKFDINFNSLSKNNYSLFWKNLFLIKPSNYLIAQDKSGFIPVKLDNLLTIKVSIFNKVFNNTLYLVEYNGRSRYILFCKNKGFVRLNLSSVFAKQEIVNADIIGQSYIKNIENIGQLNKVTYPWEYNKASMQLTDKGSLCPMKGDGFKPLDSSYLSMLTLESELNHLSTNILVYSVRPEYTNLEIQNISMAIRENNVNPLLSYRSNLNWDMIPLESIEYATQKIESVDLQLVIHECLKYILDFVNTLKNIGKSYQSIIVIENNTISTRLKNWSNSFDANRWNLNFRLLTYAIDNIINVLIKYSMQLGQSDSFTRTVDWVYYHIGINFPALNLETMSKRWQKISDSILLEKLFVRSDYTIDLSSYDDENGNQITDRNGVMADPDVATPKIYPIIDQREFVDNSNSLPFPELGEVESSSLNEFALSLTDADLGDDILTSEDWNQITSNSIQLDEDSLYFDPSTARLFEVDDNQVTYASTQISSTPWPNIQSSNPSIIQPSNPYLQSFNIQPSNPSIIQPSNPFNISTVWIHNKQIFTNHALPDIRFCFLDIETRAVYGLRYRDELASFLNIPLSDIKSLMNNVISKIIKEEGIFQEKYKFFNSFDRFLYERPMHPDNPSLEEKFAVLNLESRKHYYFRTAEQVAKFLAIEISSVHTAIKKKTAINLLYTVAKIGID